jgi:hypothetical protein
MLELGLFRTPASNTSRSSAPAQTLQVTPSAALASHVIIQYGGLGERGCCNGHGNTANHLQFTRAVIVSNLLRLNEPVMDPSTLLSDSHHLS